MMKVNGSLSFSSVKVKNARHLLMAFASLLLIPTSSLFAVTGPFTIQITNYGTVGGLPAPQEVKDEINSAFISIQNEVNSKLPQADRSSYLKGMSNAGVIAVKGQGADYATSPSVFIAGLSAGAGADLGNSSLSDLMDGKVKSTEIRGVGVQGSLLLGLHLGVFNFQPNSFIDLNKINVFMNFFNYKFPTKGTFQGKVSAFGLHAQYKIIEEKKLPWHLLRWGGVDITTGFDISSMQLSFRKTFNKSATQDLGSVSGFPANAQLNANFDGLAVAGAKVSIFTIPIEASTHLQLLYFLTLFGGLGLDISTGSATSLADLTGNVTASDSTNTLTGVAARADLDLGDKGRPSPFTARWFAGAQFNILLVKIYAQVNHGIGQGTWGVNGGLRISY